MTNLRTQVRRVRVFASLLAIALLMLAPMQPALAATTTFNDDQVGHSNELLQQEAEFEHNPESELIEDNDLTHGDIPQAEVAEDSGDEELESPIRNPITYPAEPLDVETDEIPGPQLCTPPSGPDAAESTPEETITEPEDLDASSESAITGVSIGDESEDEPAEPNTDTDNVNEATPPCVYFVGDDSEGPATGEGEITDDSEVDSEADVEYEVDIINMNDIQVNNVVDTEALSGENETVSEGDIEQTNLESGDVNVFANVLNVVNTNMYNSEIVEMVENFNDLTTDLYMNALETSPQERTQDLVSGICDGTVECESLATFRLTNSNRADLNNDVLVAGNSGSNTIDGFEVEDSSIKTGDVNALVNVLNIVNSNMVNSRWTIASFNVFGDWEGDLVMPSEMYFRDAMAIGTVVDSDVLISEIQKVVLNVDNRNDAVIENNVFAETDTGSNAIEATATFDPEEEREEGGDIEESSIESGNGESHVNVNTQTNITLYNGMWFLGMVNTLGEWSGDIYALPEEVAMVEGDFGTSFFATSEQDPAVRAAFEDAVAEATLESEITVDIENSNEADITNNVLVGAYTGDNTITATEVERSRIQTGNARALANVLNFANTNLINADLYVGLTNIFGNWNGNIVFGYPDLAVNQTLKQGDFPQAQGQQVNYQLDFSNDAGTAMRDARMEWQYDPSLLQLDHVSSPFNYVIPTTGTIVFDLGNLPGRSNGSAQIELRSSQNLPEQSDVETMAHIYGSGPERDLTDNLSVLHVASGPNVVEVPSLEQNLGGGNEENSLPTTEPQDEQEEDEEQAQNETSAAGKLVVTKTNNAGGKVLSTGDEITFTITVKNSGSTLVDNVVVYDRLTTPAGDPVYSETYPVETLRPGQSATIEYDLGITADVPAGVYTNSAYAQGFGAGLKLVKSTTVRSSFTVGDGTDDKKEVIPVLDVPQEPAPVVPSEPVVAPGVDQASDQPLAFDSKFEGARNAFGRMGLGSSKNTGRSGSTLGAFSPKNANISLIPEAAATGFGVNSFGNPWVSSVLVSLLIATGYALASVREKAKLKKQKSEEIIN